MTSAAVTLSSVGFGLRLTTPNLPRTPFGSLQDSRPRGPRHSARTGRGAQLGEQIGDSFGRQIVLDSESAGLFATILILRPKLAQPHLKSLRDGGLRSETPQDQLAGRVDPVRRQGGDHLTPDLRLDRIEIRRRLRATCTGNHYGDDGKRGWRFTATSHWGFPFATGCDGRSGGPVRLVRMLAREPGKNAL